MAGTTAISINIDNTQLTRVITAMCTAGNYQTTINGQPNPQTPAQFAKQMVATYVLNAVKQVETQTAVDTARTQAISNVDSQVVIT